MSPVAPPDSRGRRSLPGGPRRPGARRPLPTQPSPVRARPRSAARTHLAVELADRHDPARRAEPGCRASGRPPRCPSGSVHGGPAWRHLPGLAESWCVSRPFPPTCPAGFQAARPLLPRRRRRCGRAGVASGRGRRPRGAAPRSGVGGGAGVEPGRGGVTCGRRSARPGSVAADDAYEPAGPGCTHPPAPPPPPPPRGPPGRGRGGRGAGGGRPLLDAGARGTGARPLPHLPRHAPGPRGLRRRRLGGAVVQTRIKRGK